MNNPDLLILQLTLRDGYGRVHGTLVREVPREAAYIGNRAIPEARLFLDLGIKPLDNVIERMKVREVRKELLAQCARSLGRSLAEHLEDREGWHGMDRQERVESLYSGTRPIDGER